MSAGMAAVLVLSHVGVFAAGLLVRDRRRRRVLEMDGWLQEDVIARKRANWLQARENQDLADALEQASGEHPTADTVVGDDLDPEPWANHKPVDREARR